MCVLVSSQENPLKPPWIFWVLADDPGWQQGEGGVGTNQLWYWNHVVGFPIWVFSKMVVPQNGWFIMKNSIEMDDLGAPLFSETPI